MIQRLEAAMKRNPLWKRSSGHERKLRGSATVHRRATASTEACVGYWRKELEENMEL
jgi:ribosomal protein L35